MGKKTDTILCPIFIYKCIVVANSHELSHFSLCFLLLIGLLNNEVVSITTETEITQEMNTTENIGNSRNNNSLFGGQS